MKRSFLTPLVFGLLILFLSPFSWAQCPEDPGDQGECDTLNLTCYDCEVDTLAGGPYTVQFPLYVTNDLTDPIDSIASFIVPLAWTRNNPSAYCSVSGFWNNTWLYPFPDFLTKNSIYHHITDPATGDTLIRNRMMDMSETLLGTDWDTRILDLDGTSHFWLSMFPTGGADQRWWEADRALLATMTFRVADTMHVCIDTTFWPPASRLNFIRDDGVGYIPRDNLPRCFFIGPAQPPLCDVDPTSLDFGTVTLGDSADLTFSISNIGGGTLSGTVSETCDDYYLVGDVTYSLTSGQSKDFTVRFKPLSAGVKNCTVETGAETCADVSCTGTGEEAPVCGVDPTSLDFGTVTLGDSADLTFSISNTGGGTLSGTVSEACDDYYLVGDLTYSLTSGQSKDFTVRFKPLSAGVKNCTIETGNETCADVSCTGTGEEAPVCVVDSTSLDFGTVTVGDSADLTFSISNTGGGTLSGTVSETCDDYYLVGDLTYSLTSGQSKDFTLRFKPLSAGVKNCTVETGEDACADVSCTGTGEEAGPVHFVFKDNTGDSYSIVVDSAFLDAVELEDGDEIGVFDDTSGAGGLLCVGASVYRPADLPIPLVAWKDDPLTPEQDGYTAGDTMYFRVWSSNQSREEEACADYTVGDGHFESGIFSQLWLQAPGPCAPVCLVDSTSLDFGTVSIGDSLDLTFSISNTGGGTLSGTVSETCDDYYLVGDVSYSLTSGQSKDFTVRFKPSSAGVINCTIETGDDACADVNCTGTGQGNYPAAPSDCAASDDLCDRVEFCWTDNSDNETGFYVYRNSAKLDSVGLDVTCYDDSSAAAGITYEYCVSAYNDYGESGQCCDSGRVNSEAITVTAPNGGESWGVGTLRDISWTHSCLDTVKIEYSTNSGSDWTTEAEKVPAAQGSYSWSVPDAPSENCLIRICDAEDGAPCDESDAAFAITVEDFAIEVSPDTIRIMRTVPEDSFYTVMLTSIGGFDSPCTLTVSGLPSGASGVFDDSVLVPTATTRLVISADETVAEGYYDLTVTAAQISGTKAIEHSQDVVLLVVLPTWGFDLEAEPDSQDVVVGDQVAYDITMLPDIGFTAPCTLYLDSGPPPDASFDFNPGVIFPNETSVLTITTGASTPDSVYQLTVRGIANYKEQDYVDVILVTLVVQDFTLTAPTDTQYVTQGQSIGIAVELGSVNGFADPCTLTVTGLPDPPDSGEFDLPTLVPPGTSILTVYTEPQTPTGVYTLTINAQCQADGKAEPLEHEVQVLLKVTEATGVDDWAESANTPKSFALFQNQPNPFNPETQIGYYLPQACHVSLTIYNVLGRKVRTLFDGHQESGTQGLIWDGRSDDGLQLSSGIYFYRLQAQNFMETKKMTLMK
jgi:hypothetical protein